MRFNKLAILDSLTRRSRRRTANDTEEELVISSKEESAIDVHTFRAKETLVQTFRNDLITALRMAQRISRISAGMPRNTHPKESALAILASKFPAATDAECQRFLKARRGNLQTASEKLGEYMDWRLRYQLDRSDNVDGHRTNRTDAQDWTFAAKLALELDEHPKQDSHPHFNKQSLHKRPKPKTLPQIVTVYYLDEINRFPCQTIDNNLILHVLPAQVNKKIATPETYALAMAIYLDLKFDRYSTSDFASIFIDVRPGRGWANPPAYTMMPFITHVSKLLHHYFPERLHQCIIYPLPKAAIWIWDMAKRFLDKDVVNAVLLIGGSDALTAATPIVKLSQFLDKEIIDRMEQRRYEFFVTPLENVAI